MGSRESTVTVDGGHDGDSGSSLPALEDLISQAKAARKECIAVSRPGQGQLQATAGSQWKLEGRSSCRREKR